ncbi:MAG: cytochrome c3 family protein, partial [Sutterella sp.]|nr:cytochrome c3 family protein [Sutterella sp.]
MAKGVACTACHVEAMKAVPTRDTCLTCHGPVEKLAAKTEHLNFTSRMKNAKTGQTVEHKALVNPHDRTTPERRSPAANASASTRRAATTARPATTPGPGRSDRSAPSNPRPPRHVRAAETTV